MPHADSEVRERIKAAVQEAPGIHMRELERRVGISFGAVDHHVHVLERRGDVVAFWDGHFRRLFATDLVLPSESRRLNEDDRRFLALCRRHTSLAIVLNIAAEGRLRHGELQRRIGRSKATLSYHLERMMSVGVIRTSTEASERGYELADRGRAISLLVTFAPALRGHVDGFADLWTALRDGRTEERGDPTSSERSPDGDARS